MSQDDADADYVVVDDDDVDVDYPYPWDNEPDEPDCLQPKTPLHRPNHNDPMEPRNRRDRDYFRSRVGDDGSLTLPGQIKGLMLPGQIEGSSQETQDDYPVRISQQELPSDSLNSDDLSGYPRLSLSDLLNGTEAMTPRHNRRAPIAKETPLTLRMSANTRATEPNKAEDKHRRNADEAMRVLIGPMPVEKFLDEFLPAVDESDMPDPTSAFDAVPRGASDEKEIYYPFIAAINENGRCPGLTFVDTSVTSEQNTRGVFKPDVSTYNAGDVSLLKRIRSKKGSKIYTCANLGIAESFCEIKPDNIDPLMDDSEKEGKHFFDWKNYRSDKDGIAAKKKRAFGQNVSYAAESCARQHRVFYHSLLIIGTRARFFRWDRAGVIVTRAFDYQEHPRLLCRYLWRFSGANMVERGFDPTVTVASKEETDVFEKVVSAEVAFQLGIDGNDKEKMEEALKTHFDRNKVTKAMVYNYSGSKAEEYLLSVPVHCPSSAAGRSCRGYWSTKVVRKLDGSIERGEIRFLKDVWRIALPRLAAEGEILTEMTGNVPNIPEPDCFGDIKDDSCNKPEVIADGGDPVIGASGKVQTTRTQEFIYKEWVSKSCRVLPKQSVDDLYRRVVKHVHYRMTSKTVGYPLSDFIDAPELFLALEDVLEALIIAYEKCKRLHRDVSLDNVILCRCRVTKRRLGILIDWEFSVLIDRKGKAGDYFRSGTWAFMSANVLRRSPDFHHTHQDDLESLFYISLYSAVYWLRHNEKQMLGSWMFEFFDQYSVRDNGIMVGGFVKQSYKLDPTEFSNEFIFENDHINTWFGNAYRDLSTFSRMIKPEDSTWTSNNVRKHMRAVCKGLSEPKQPGLDRVEHSVEDQFIPEQPWQQTVTSGAEIGGPSEEPQPENKRSRVSILSIHSNRSPLKLNSDGGTDDDIGEQQDQNQESQDQESPDELLLQSLTRKGQHDPRRTVNEDLSSKPDLPNDDDGDDDLYV
ncbi:hypothetical protein ACEPAF_5841 [Sanghuangporus sanghuang]